MKMTQFSQIFAEVQADTDDDLIERIAHAKRMKQNFQTVIEACQRTQEMRRALAPAAKEPTGAGEILDRVAFTGVLEGRPMFEFQARIPPPWLVDAIKGKRIQVLDGVAYADQRILSSGDVVAAVDFS